MTKKLRVDGQDVPVSEPTEIIETYTNIKTGEVYKNEAAYKAANIPPDDLRKDVKVIMPPLDLFGKN